MAKVTISIPDDLLAEVDALAAELNESRSGLVQEATASYVTAAKTHRFEAARRARIERAIKTARSLAPYIGSFDSAAAIRAERDGDSHRSESQ